MIERPPARKAKQDFINALVERALVARAAPLTDGRDGAPHPEKRRDRLVGQEPRVPTQGPRFEQPRSFVFGKVGRVEDDPRHLLVVPAHEDARDRGRIRESDQHDWLVDVQGGEDCAQLVGLVALQDIGQVALMKWVDEHGGDYKTIKFVEIPTIAAPGAVEEGRVVASECTQPAIAAGFAVIWALAWRRQSSAVTAIEERDGARFYIERTSPLRPAVTPFRRPPVRSPP